MGERPTASQGHLEKSAVDGRVDRLLEWPNLGGIGGRGACGNPKDYEVTMSKPTEMNQIPLFTFGAHPKTGQWWTGQNRPVREPPQARVFYRVRS